MSCYFCRTVILPLIYDMLIVSQIQDTCIYEDINAYPSELAYTLEMRTPFYLFVHHDKYFRPH